MISFGAIWEFFVSLLGSIFSFLPSSAGIWATAIVVLLYVANKALDDLLSEAIKRTSLKLRQIARRLSRRTSKRLIPDAEFHIGEVHADIFILEHFPEGTTDGQIVCSLTHGPEIVPSELQADYDFEVAEFEKQEKEGKVFAGKKLAVKEINITRIETTRAPMLKMAFQATNYRHQTAMQNIFQKLSAGQRSDILKQPFVVNKIYSNTFGCNVTVITDDSKFLVAKRSPLVGPERSALIFGIAEGMTDVDVVNYRTPDIRLTALRSLSRELGLPLEIDSADRINLVSLSLNKKYYQYNFQGYIDLRDSGEEYTAHAIIQRIGLGRVADKFEYDKVTALKFRPEDIVSFIRQNQQSIANYSIVAAIYTLARFYGWPAVERACK